MVPPLSRLEYWLLDVAAEHGMPLQMLPEGHIELALNRPSLGASNAELARGLVALSGLGLVTLETPDCVLDAAGLEKLISVPPRDGMIYDGKHWYSLTAAGGAEWERAARPDWNLYVEYRTWPECDGWQHSILCADAGQAERYLAFQRSVWHKPGAVPEESVVRDVLRPWEATHWRELPEAYLILFRTGGEEARRYPSAGEAAQWDYRWHDDPWEGSGLP
ncbi:MAG: hypothetical protein ACHQ1G_12010 [Planctomycetota bacterium]